MCKWLGITPQIERSSQLGVDGDKSARLLNLCKRFGADRYLSGDAAQAYLDVGMFADNGVRVEWQGYRHPTYRQLHGEFMPFLSTLDLIFNMGPESLGIIQAQS